MWYHRISINNAFHLSLLSITLSCNNIAQKAMISVVNSWTDNDEWIEHHIVTYASVMEISQSVLSTHFQLKTSAYSARSSKLHTVVLPQHDFIKPPLLAWRFSMLNASASLREVKNRLKSLVVPLPMKRRESGNKERERWKQLVDLDDVSEISCDKNYASSELPVKWSSLFDSMFLSWSQGVMQDGVWEP